MTVKPTGQAQPGTQLEIPNTTEADQLAAELDQDAEVDDLLGADEDEEPETATPGAQVPPVVPPPASAAPAAATPPAADPLLDDEDKADGITPDGEEFVRVPAAAFRAIKERARRQGAGAASAATVETAKRHGFTDLDDAMARLRALTETPPAPKDQPMANTGKLADLKQKARKAITSLKSQHQTELSAKDQEIATLKAQMAERDKAAQDAATEAEVRGTLRAAGFVDEEYAMVLFKKEVAGKSKDEVATFITTLPAWAGTVKAAKPFLFGETAPAPANTAPPAATPTPGVATPPGAPATPPATPPAQAPVTKNAKDMTRAELADAMKAKGLSVTGSVPVGRPRAG